MYPSKNREKVASFSIKNEILQADTESPPRVLATVGILPTPPLQLLPTLRFRPTTSILQSTPLKRKRPSTLRLECASGRYSSGARPPDKERSRAEMAKTAAVSSPVETGQAPLADGVHLSEDAKPEPHQQPNRRAGARTGKRSRSGRRPCYWVTFKTISRVFMVLGVGVVAVDLYLASWSSKVVSRERPRSALRATQPIAARESEDRSYTGTSAFTFRDKGTAVFPHGSPDFGGPFGGPRPLKNGPVADNRIVVSEHEGTKKSSVDRVLSLLSKGLGIDQQNQPVQHLRQLRSDPREGQRVAVVVPYARTELPVWWEVFAEQASLNEGLVDWLVFCDEKLVRKDGPPNIKFFPTSLRHMAWILSEVVEPDARIPSHRSGGGGGGSAETAFAFLTAFGGGISTKLPRRKRGEHSKGVETSASSALTTASAPVDGVLTERQRVASRLHRLLLTLPSCVADFKPAFGWLFREHLKDYTHWAFGELDVLFGDMTKGWLGAQELREFDIITFSRGDQHRAYIRGQLTVHKNTDAVNRVWRRCSYLTNYSERMEAFRVDREIPLENAKDCYGRAVALEPSLRVTFAVKAIPSMSAREEEMVATLGGREVVIGANGLVTLCPDLGHYADSSGSMYGVTTAGTEVRDEMVPRMQDAVGPMTRIRQANISEKCEHWIESEHETCVKGVGPTQALFLVDGEYWKQEFINTAAATKGGKDCLGGAFYHFKEHKQNYRVWNSRPPVEPAHSGVAVGPGGIVPLPATGWRQRLASPGLPPTPEHTSKVKHYCLGWTERLQSRVLGRTRKEQVCAVKVSSEEVVVIVDTRVAAEGTSNASADAVKAETISMGAVGRPQDLEAFRSNAEKWEGPKIFAMALDGQQLVTTRYMEILKFLERTEGVLVVVLPRPPSLNPDAAKVHASLPVKALMNLVSDLCESRYLFMLPESSLVDHRTFKTVATRLFNDRATPVSSMERSSTSSSKAAAKKGINPKSPAPGVPSPVTLVVPLVTPKGGMLPDKRHNVRDAAETGGIAGKSRGGRSWLMRQRGQRGMSATDLQAVAEAAVEMGSKASSGEGTAAGLLRISFVGPVEDRWPPGRATSMARQLESFKGDAATNRMGRDGQAAKEESGDEREWAPMTIADREESEWIRSVLMSGPTMPGLVVDLWSPGAMFLRHVEEFGDSGCMDAGYALGLWAAGSHFKLVEATLRSAALPAMRNVHSEDSSAFQPGASGHELRFPGGSCLRNDVVAHTASIYSAFLLQVSNVYRHPQSGIAGREEGRRKYHDHWDHFEDEAIA